MKRHVIWLGLLLVLLGAGRARALLCGLDRVVGRDFVRTEIVGQSKLDHTAKYVGQSKVPPIEIVGRGLSDTHMQIVSQTLFTPPRIVSQTKFRRDEVAGQAKISPEVDIVGRNNLSSAKIVGQTNITIGDMVGQEPSCSDRRP